MYEVKMYNCETDNIKITEWLPYLILSEADIAEKLAENYEYLWEMNTWDTLNFMEIRDKDSDEILGRCLLGMFEGYTQIFTLYVPPIFRRRGVAKTLIDKCIEYSEEYEYSYINVGTRVSNVECNKLLKSFNFKFVDNKVSEYSGKVENSYRLDL